jgi:hypothetical protein
MDGYFILIQLATAQAVEQALTHRTSYCFAGGPEDASSRKQQRTQFSRDRICPKPEPQMNRSNTPILRGLNTFSLVGASIGLLVFLVVALVPSLLYGGVAGQLANGLFGVPDVASLFAALGAVAGAFVDPRHL